MVRFAVDASLGARRSAIHLLVAAILAAVLLAQAAGAGATSLIATHMPGGVIHVAFVQQDPGTTVAVSRSVGLMEGATADVGSTSLNDSLATVSRSVGLMQGASGSAAQADLGYSPENVTRSIGLMEGALD